MLEKDRKKINEELTKLIKHKLLNEFKDHKLKSVESVESINILDLIFDDKNQDRNKIIVNEFIAAIRVHILFNNDGSSTSSLNTHVKNNIPIEFVVNSETDEVEITDSAVKLLEERLY